MQFLFWDTETPYTTQLEKAFFLLETVLSPEVEFPGVWNTKESSLLQEQELSLSKFSGKKKIYSDLIPFGAWKEKFG